MQASSGFTGYLWNTAATGQQITVTQSGSYSVQATSATGCVANSGPYALTVPPQGTVPVYVNGNFVFTTSGAAYQWYLNGAAIPGATGQTWQALQNGNYHVEVTDTNGCMSVSSPVFVNAANPAQCDSITGLNTSGITTASALLSWSLYPQAVIKELAWRQSGATTWNFVQLIGGLVTNYSIQNLLPATAYQWSIRSICDPTGALASPFSPIQTFVTLPACLEPDTIFTSRISPSSARVNWNPVSGSLGYVVAGATLNSTQWLEIPVSNPNATFLDLSGLQNGVTYKVRVKTICTQNPPSFSPWTATDTFTASCQTPQNLHTPIVQRTAIRVAWDRVFGCAGYAIQGRQAGAGPGATQNLLVAGSANTVKDIYGLQPNTAYELRIRTWCDGQGINKSPWSNWIPVTTLPRLEGEGLLAENGFDIAPVFYPNPTTGMIYTDWKPDHPQPVEVQVFNIHGKQVGGKLYPKETEGLLEIDLSAQASGLYFIRLLTNTRTYSARVVKE